MLQNVDLLIVQNIERNGSVWGNKVFEKYVIFHSNNKRLQAGPEAFYYTSERHKSVQQGWVFYVRNNILQLRNKIEIESKFSKTCYFSYVGTQEVRIRVFDNYQRCPVSLRDGTSNPKRCTHCYCWLMISDWTVQIRVRTRAHYMYRIVSSEHI